MNITQDINALRGLAMQKPVTYDGSFLGFEHYAYYGEKANVPLTVSSKLFVKSYDLYIETVGNFKDLAFERRNLIGLPDFPNVRYQRVSGEASQQDRYKPYAILAKSMVYLALNPEQLLAKTGITENSIGHLKSMVELVIADATNTTLLEH